MRKLFIIPALWLLNFTALAQIPDAMKLPDFVQPTPEVSSLIKADNLSVGYVTGSPNIVIPIGALAVNGIKLPINISYNSTGIKVDDYASMVGTGWNCSNGGVISRTIFDKPDENRQSYPDEPTNFDDPDFNNPDLDLLDFLKNTYDAESDVFSFSFLNYSGKFILDSAQEGVIPLSTYNMVISLIDNDFTKGFEIVTDDGTTYRFEDEEISKNRSPQGSGCPKNTETLDKKTSWYLTKITAPNKRSFMTFTYVTHDITYEQSITQYISVCTFSESYIYYGGSCPSGSAASVGSETFYTCIPRQLVTSKFISKIITSANDTAAFYYDSSPREDLDSGQRLSQIIITNRNGAVIRQATFYDSYWSGSGSSAYSSFTKRMYLDSMKLDDITDSENSVSYKFEYIDRANVSARLTFMQDLYGYSNGKTSNESLIPILPLTDLNYDNFNSGTGGNSVNFGDRSIDTLYAIKGLLNKIIYPTGGYDSIIYRPNKYYTGGVDTLAGGSSVSSICSYSFGQKVFEKSFSYTDTSNHSSTFLITSDTRFSDTATIKKDGYTCSATSPPGSISICIGPLYRIGSVSSNIITPISTLGGQHAYHVNVKEKIVGETDNGYTEHHYEFFNGGNLVPYYLMGNRITSVPLRVVSEFVLGEDMTKIYRYDTSTSSYKLQKSVKNYTSFDNYVPYYNYVIKRNCTAAWGGSPTPYTCEFEPYDVTKYPINKYDVYTDSTKEITYDNNNDSFIVKTTTEHGNSVHSYPTKQIVYTPDGDVLETRRAYPLDGSASVMTYRNIVATVLEEKKYKNSTLLSTVTNTYEDWFEDSTVVALQQTEYKEQTNSMPAHIKYIDYDTMGNVLEIAKDSGVHKSYIWGYNLQLPIAAVTNAAENEIFHTSFEETDGTSDADAKTGGKSRTSNYYVGFTLPNGKNYILSYWYWDGTKWVYYETAYTAPLTITVTNKIDEVRVYPKDAQMVTFTYEPMIGITSQCDVRNQVSYYEYDALNRLKVIYDEKRKILKAFDYKYQQ